LEVEENRGGGVRGVGACVGGFGRGRYSDLDVLRYGADGRICIALCAMGREERFEAESDYHGWDFVMNISRE